MPKLRAARTCSLCRVQWGATTAECSGVLEGGVEWSLARYARIVLSKIVLSKVQHVLFGTSWHLIGQLAPRHAEPRLVVQVEHKEVLLSIALCGARLPSSAARQASAGLLFSCAHQGSRARRARFCSFWRSVSVSVSGLVRRCECVFCSCAARKSSAGSECSSGYLPQISCRMMCPGHEGSRVRLA